MVGEENLVLGAMRANGRKDEIIAIRELSLFVGRVVELATDASIPDEKKV